MPCRPLPLWEGGGHLPMCMWGGGVAVPNRTPLTTFCHCALATASVAKHKCAAISYAAPPRGVVHHLVPPHHHKPRNPIPPAHPLWVRLLHLACLPPPLPLISHLHLLLPAPVCLYSLHPFLPYPLGLLLLTHPRSLPLALELLCSLLVWRLRVPHLHLLDALAP